MNVNILPDGISYIKGSSEIMGTVLINRPISSIILIVLGIIIILLGNSIYRGYEHYNFVFPIIAVGVFTIAIAIGLGIFSAVSYNHRFEVQLVNTHEITKNIELTKRLEIEDNFKGLYTVSRKSVSSNIYIVKSMKPIDVNNIKNLPFSEDIKGIYNNINSFKYLLSNKSLYKLSWD